MRRNAKFRRRPAETTIFPARRGSLAEQRDVRRHAATTHASSISRTGLGDTKTGGRFGYVLQPVHPVGDDNPAPVLPTARPCSSSSTRPRAGAAWRGSSVCSTASFSGTETPSNSRSSRVGCASIFSDWSACAAMTTRVEPARLAAFVGHVDAPSTRCTLRTATDRALAQGVRRFSAHRRASRRRRCARPGPVAVQCFSRPWFRLNRMKFFGRIGPDLHGRRRPDGGRHRIEIIVAEGARIVARVEDIPACRGRRGRCRRASRKKRRMSFSIVQ